MFSMLATSKENNPPTIKSVMRSLGAAMNSLNDGIFTEDYDLIRESAQKITVHPKPKSQMSTIIKTLKFRIFRFKSLNNEVHDSALEIINFAKKKDIKGVLESHKVIMNNCVSCHTQFKNELSKAFRD
jgi:hypothetical protein